MARRSSKRGSDNEKTNETPIEDVSDAVQEATEDPSAEVSETAPGAANDTGDGSTASDAPDATTDAAENAGDVPQKSDVEDAEILNDDADTSADDETPDGDADEPVTEDTDQDVTDSEDSPTEAEAAVETDTPTDLDETTEPTTEASSTPAPATQTVVRERGPGFVPLVLGGVVAAGLGYLGTTSGILPGSGPQGPSPELAAQIAQQSETLATLQEQIAALASAEAPDIDLGPINDTLADLGARIDESAAVIGTLSERVVTLEERPVFTGDVTADTAEAAEAIAALEEQMRQREEDAAARAAEIEANARAAEAAAAAAQAEAEAAMAAAEAEAAAATAAAAAEAALDELRLAITEGQAFAEPLADVQAVAEVPDGLQARADVGVPSLESLQDRFPAVARAALPVALREAAGDRPVDRFTAFVQGQIGGRAIEPREGDSPDAIMSRVQANVTAGDLPAALAEIAALPEGAQAEMADWIADAQARADAISALDTVTQTLSGGN